MAFDLQRVREELQGAPLESPYPLELSAAIASDLFRLAGRTPPPPGYWRRERKPKTAQTLFGEQVGMLAHALATTSLRGEAVQALRSGGARPDKLLDGFFEAIAPLTAEMIRSNSFRQEEFLRRFVEAVGAQIAGETERVSARRLEQLDYRKTLLEFERAEKARASEAERRAKLLAEAAKREADARGWRE